MRHILLAILLLLPSVAQAQRTGPSLNGAYRRGGTVTVNATDIIFNMTSTFDFQIQTGGVASFVVTQDGAVFNQNATDTTTAFQILDQDGGAPVFNVDTVNERMGLGTASPNRPFEIDNVLPLLRITRDASYKWELGVDNGTFADTSDFIIRDVNDNQVRLCIEQVNGNVGVSDTDPQGVVTISASGGAVDPFHISSDDGTDGDWLKVDNTGLVTAGVGVTVAAGDITASQGAIATTPDATTLGNGATALAVDACVVTVTGDGGGNTVATITGGVSGQLLTLIFVDGLVTITDTDAHNANTVDLVGTASDFTSADDTVLQLVYNGTSWYQVAPASVN